MSYDDKTLPTRQDHRLDTFLLLAFVVGMFVSTVMGW